jgi:hypothetical protein
MPSDLSKLVPGPSAEYVIDPNDHVVGTGHEKSTGRFVEQIPSRAQPNPCETIRVTGLVAKYGRYALQAYANNLVTVS